MRKLISLGLRCDVAFQLRMHSGDNTSHFFDWLALPARAVIEIIRNDFNVFFPEDLRHLPVGDGHFHVEDAVTETQFHHHFPMIGGSVIPDFLVNYPQFIGKFDYLANRFREHVNTHKVTLVRRKITKDEAEELETVFFERFPGSDVEFLYLNSSGPVFATPRGQSHIIEASKFDLGDPITWSRFLAEHSLIDRPYLLSPVEVLGKGHEGYGLGHANRFTKEHMLDAISFNPENPEFQIELSKIYKRNGDHDKAMKCLEGAKTLGANPDTIEYLTLMTLRDARIISDEVFLDKARLLPQVDDSPAQLGYSFYRAGRYELALFFLNRYIKSHHWDDQAVLFKALTLKHLSRFEAAERAVAAAIRLNPNRSRSRLLNSLLLIRRGDIETAITEADQAVRLDPKKPDLYVHKAKLLERAKRYGEALASAKAAVCLDGAAEAGVQQVIDKLAQRLQGVSPVLTPAL